MAVTFKSYQDRSAIQGTLANTNLNGSSKFLLYSKSKLRALWIQAKERVFKFTTGLLRTVL